jgi:hypothetical protein
MTDTLIEPNERPSLSIDGVTYFQHSLSALFPAMGIDEYAQLKTSIQTMGLQKPIELIEGTHDVIDGWHRLQACASCGVTPQFCYTPQSDQLLDRVVSANLERRNLSVAQIVVVVGKIANLRSGSGRPAHRADPQTVAEPPVDANDAQGANDANDAGEENRLTLDYFSESQPADNARDTLDAVAKSHGVSRASLAKGKKIACDGLPEIASAVAAKQISLDDAYQIARQPKEAQKSLFQQRLDEGKSAHKAGRKGRTLHEMLVKHIREHKEPPPDADPERIESAYFELANDATNAGQLMLALVNRDPDCINEQGLTQLIATANQILEFVHTKHPEINLRAGLR